MAKERALEGAVCVVSGAGSGIGAEIARQLAAAGGKVALLDRQLDAAEEVADQIRAAGEDALALQCDVASDADVGRAGERVADRMGPCEVLVNNAAIIYAASLLEVKMEKWNDLLSVNLTGYFRCAQVFGKQMLPRRKGSMIHIGSIAGQVPQPYSGAYSISKAGVRMMSQLLAAELGEHGVRSNVVSPFMCRTPMSSGIYSNPEVLAHRERIVPARRIGMPADIANAVLFLATDQSEYISGQELMVDGGLTTAWMTLIPRPGFEKSTTPT